MFIDLSMPITAGSVFRFGMPPVKIETRTFYHESEGEYESVILTFAAHTATHIDLVFRTRRVTPERMITRAKLIDVSNVGGREIRISDVKNKAPIEIGDSVFLRTDWSELSGSDVYHHNHPELSLELVKWLGSKRLNAVGIDAPGLGRGIRHGEYDQLLAKNDVIVIENLVNLAAVPKPSFTAVCLPLNIDGVDAIPARVLAWIQEEDW